MASGNSTSRHSLESINSYCGYIGVSAAAIKNEGPTSSDINDTASLISKKTAFDFSKTKSRINEIANNIGIQSTLTLAEIAGFTYFWCMYDEIGVQVGTDDVFEIQEDAIKQYQIMF